MMNENILKNNIIKGAIAWYSFEKGKRALLLVGIKDEFRVLANYLKDKYIDVDVIQVLENKDMNFVANYDYIISALGIESLSKNDELTATVAKLKNYLNPGGKLLILADNRLAIRYFTGDKDLFSGRVFDGIENYKSYDLKKADGKGYSKSEWLNGLSDNGFISQIYGVFPSVFNANMFIKDGYKPNENMIERINAYYYNPGTVYSDERYLYNTLKENDMLISMANGFFIESAINDDLVDYNQITVQSNRNIDSALVTYISDEEVVKRPMWTNKNTCLESVKANAEYLLAHGVPMAEFHIDNDAYATKFINGPIATEYFQNLIETDVEQFFREFDIFINILINSSEHVSYDEVDWDRFDPNWKIRKADDPNKDYWRNLANGSEDDKKQIGPILERGYIDLTTINCVRGEEGFEFFDQEFYIKDFPVKALIFRAISFIFRKPEVSKIILMDDVLKKYDLYEKRDIWGVFYNKPLAKILHNEELSVDSKKHSIDYRATNDNRLRMDYSNDDYERYFVDIFKGVFDRKLYIFGSGVFAEKFLKLYGANLDIAGILDNNKERQGGELNGIKIISPEALKAETTSYKVIICIKYYDEVLKQLKELGAVHMSIYNPAKSYEMPRKTVAEITSDDNLKATSKKYHTGYVAGVFDLFHVGHVNILKRAKEQCDHLIVGVVSDEQVMKSKKTMPHYKFEDRLELVNACKYVDEAYMIPIDRAGTEDAYEMYRFDAQFSGSDYENDPHWLSAREFLRQRGSDLIFFSYTEGISTTKIKEELRK